MHTNDFETLRSDDEDEEMMEGEDGAYHYLSYSARRDNADEDMCDEIRRKLVHLFRWE
jgi:hypothetical protein